MQRKGDAVKLVADVLQESDRFFTAVESACDTLVTDRRSEASDADKRARKAELMTPATSAALDRATDLVGYGPYLDRVPVSRADQRRGTEQKLVHDFFLLTVGWSYMAFLPTPHSPVHDWGPKPFALP